MDICSKAEDIYEALMQVYEAWNSIPDIYMSGTLWAQDVPFLSKLPLTFFDPERDKINK